MYTEEFSQILQNSIRIHKLKLANGASFGQKYTYDAADDTLKKVEMTTPFSGFSPSVTYTYSPPCGSSRGKQQTTCSIGRMRTIRSALSEKRRRSSS